MSQGFDVRSQMSLLGEDENSRLTETQRQTARRNRLLESGIMTKTGGALLVEDANWVVHDRFPQMTEALDAVQRFEYTHSGLGIHRANTLFLMGLRGRGKTVSGGWLLATPDRYHKGMPLTGVRMYVTAEQLRLAHRARTQEFERAAVARILVVDELGTEGDEREEARSYPKASASAQRALLELVNRRAGAHLSLTLFIANIDEDEIRARYDERTIDKVLQRGHFHVAGGPNLRVPLEQQPGYIEALERAMKARQP